MSIAPALEVTAGASARDDDLHVRISQQFDDAEWDDFVCRTPGGSHVQTSLWAQLKAGLGYRPIRIVVGNSRGIVSGGQILVRPILPGLKVAFLPKGPVCCPFGASSTETFFRALRQTAQDHKFEFLAVQPPIQDEMIPSTLSSFGFRPSMLELASVATVVIDLLPEADKILAQMKRQTRQNIRRSERDGITCREGDQNDLAAFYDLHLATTRRQGFKPYARTYYGKMWQVLEPHGYIQLMIAEYNGEAVSALLLIPFNDTVVAKILGWSGQYGERRPNDALFWASILWAKAHGYRYFDFEGIDRRCATRVLQGLPLEEESRDSYTFFKLGYGGQVVVFPQAYDYIHNSFLRWCYNGIFSAPDRWSAAYASFDRLRRQLGW